MAKKHHVLFIQSQEFFGADTMIHSLIMRYLDSDRFVIHVACNPLTEEGPSQPWQELSRIPGLRMVKANFGPSVFGGGRPSYLSLLASSVRGGMSYLRLLAYVHWHRIKIVHATEKPRDSLFAVLLAKLSPARSIVHLHVKYHERLTGRARWALTNSDLTIGVSRWVAETARQEGASRGRVTHLLNALDLDRWSAPPDSETVRRELGIAPGAVVFTIASRIFSWKGHRELLAAFEQVAREVPEALLLIVGEDDPRANVGGGSLTAELRSRVAATGLRDRVIFTGFRNDVSAVMAASDVFSMPSFEEPFGMVFLEAMALERPVVGLTNGGTPEVVEDGVTGLLSDPGDITALARNMITLARDAGLRRRLGAAGRSRVEQHFSPARLAGDAAAIYTRLLTSP